MKIKQKKINILEKSFNGFDNAFNFFFKKKKIKDGNIMLEKSKKIKISINQI